MKPFLTNKRKMIELFLLMVLLGSGYLIWSSVAPLMLFGLGFIWNWTASQKLDQLFENQRYKYSTLKLVFSLQEMIQRPFSRFHPLTRIVPKIVPAGTFWLLVIFFIQSDMPWWATYGGSLFFELTQLDSYLSRQQASL
jgi:hypothetical protein